MVNIIQTNANQIDFQSRVFAYSSWEQYISDMLDNDFPKSSKYIVEGTMVGNIKPRCGKIMNVNICDDFHLDMNIKLYDNTEMNVKSYKLNTILIEKYQRR